MSRITDSQAFRSELRIKTIAAFAAVYFFWGSTFLAIHLAIETVPPFSMASMRYLAAGTILYLWARVRGVARPNRLHVRTAFIVGGLLLLGGNGVLVWAQQYVPSGLAALLVAAVPLWVVVINSVAARQRPSRRVAAGIGLGLVGIALLVGPENALGGDWTAFLGALAIVGAAFSWAMGTFVSRRAAQPASQLMSNALSMMAGGLLLAMFAGVNGEWASFQPANVSLTSWLALAYLVVFGSFVGFSAYMWLNANVPPAQASSNFYVNPVVAVFLGWLVLGEPLTARMLIAAAVTLSAVALIVSQKREQEAPTAPGALPAAAPQLETVPKVEPPCF